MTRSRYSKVGNYDPRETPNLLDKSVCYNIRSIYKIHEIHEHEIPFTILCKREGEFPLTEYVNYTFVGVVLHQLQANSFRVSPVIFSLGHEKILLLGFFSYSLKMNCIVLVFWSFITSVRSGRYPSKPSYLISLQLFPTDKEYFRFSHV